VAARLGPAAAGARGRGGASTVREKGRLQKGRSLRGAVVVVFGWRLKEVGGSNPNLIPCRNVKDLMYCIEKGLQYIDSHETLTLMGRQPNSGVGPHTQSNTH
jgi:hypothetical protein